MSLLPDLKNYFIPDNFRSGGSCYGSGTGRGSVLEATTKCLTDAIVYYIDRLFEIVVVVSIGYVIYAGVIMITSIGDESKFVTAKKTLLYALIGLAIALMSYTIVNFVVGILGGSPVGA